MKRRLQFRRHSIIAGTAYFIVVAAEQREEHCAEHDIDSAPEATVIETKTGSPTWTKPETNNRTDGVGAVDESTAFSP
jgi:hypothetical protein